MRITIVVDRYAPEARSAAHLYEDLARGLAARGHSVTVVTKKPTENLPDGSDFPGDETRDGIRVVRMRSYLGEPRFFLLKALDQVLLALRVWLRLRFMERPEVVLVYTPPLPLAAACAAVGRPFILNLHDIYPRTAVELGRLRSRLLISAAESVADFVYRRARRFIVPAPDSVDYLTGEKGVAPGGVDLVYNWVDAATVRPGSGAAFRKRHGLGDAFVVTYAGLVGVAQDLSAVVAAARLSTTDPGILYLVIGEGSELARWKEEARDLPNVRFLPTVAREEYLEALRASDACLLALSGSLRSPAIPGKLQNIMAVAKPVVAVVPEGSAAARAVAESGCGLVTPPGDGAGLVAAVSELRADAALRERFGAAGRAFCEAQFSLETAVRVFEESLRRAVS